MIVSLLAQSYKKKRQNTLKKNYIKKTKQTKRSVFLTPKHVQSVVLYLELPCLHAGHHIHAYTQIQIDTYTHTHTRHHDCMCFSFIETKMVFYKRQNITFCFFKLLLCQCRSQHCQHSQNIKKMLSTSILQSTHLKNQYYHENYKNSNENANISPPSLQIRKDLFEGGKLRGFPKIFSRRQKSK